MLSKDGLRSQFPRSYERVARLRGNGLYSGGPAKYGAIFIHIPKTGGISIRQLLGRKGRQHLTALDYLRADPRKFAQSYKFAFVRNPWDRLVSAFEFLMAGGFGDPYTLAQRAELMSQGMTFERFVQERLPLDNVVFRPQHSFVCDGHNLMDFTGRFERLREDFAVVAGVLGLSPNLPHRNASNRREWQSYYTSETYDTVGEIYRADIEMFGY